MLSLATEKLVPVIMMVLTDLTKTVTKATLVPGGSLQTGSGQLSLKPTWHGKASKLSQQLTWLVLILHLSRNEKTAFDCDRKSYAGSKTLPASRLG